MPAAVCCLHNPGARSPALPSPTPAFSIWKAGRRSLCDAVVGVDCDIWTPVALPDVIRTDNVDQVKATLVVQGANIPVTPEAETALHARGVLLVPDFIANPGGVICAVVEYQGGGQHQTFTTTEEKVR